MADLETARTETSKEDRGQDRQILPSPRPCAKTGNNHDQFMECLACGETCKAVPCKLRCMCWITDTKRAPRSPRIAWFRTEAAVFQASSTAKHRARDHPGYHRRLQQRRLPRNGRRVREAQAAVEPVCDGGGPQEALAADEGARTADRGQARAVRGSRDRARPRTTGPSQQEGRQSSEGDRGGSGVRFEQVRGLCTTWTLRHVAIGPC